MASTRGSGAFKCFGGVTSLLHYITRGTSFWDSVYRAVPGVDVETHAAGTDVLGHRSETRNCYCVLTQAGPYQELVASVYIQRSPRNVEPSPRPPYTRRALSCQTNPIAPRRAGHGVIALAGIICCHVQLLVSSTQRSSSALRSGL